MDLRQLLYPLGFIASGAFSGRFIVQWLQSELKGRVVVTPLFWRLSVIGNALLLLHSVIQIQYPLALAQACNLTIAWRNLDLMKSNPRPISRVFTILIGAAVTTTLAFMLQSYVCFGYFDWVRTPTAPWTEGPGERLSLAWHLFGSAGIFLFSSRFWLQWWRSEQVGESTLGPSFWWMSLIGSACALTYFIRLQDTVNIMGMSFAIIPYIRNLVLAQGSRA